MFKKINCEILVFAKHSEKFRFCRAQCRALNFFVCIVFHLFNEIALCLFPIRISTDNLTPPKMIQQNFRYSLSINSNQQTSCRATISPPLSQCSRLSKFLQYFQLIVIASVYRLFILLPCKDTPSMLPPCRPALMRRDASANEVSVSAQCNQRRNSSAGEHPMRIHYVASSQPPFQFCTSYASQPRTLLSCVCVSCFNFALRRRYRFIAFFILLKFLSNLMHVVYMFPHVCGYLPQASNLQLLLPTAEQRIYFMSRSHLQILPFTQAMPPRRPYHMLSPHHLAPLLTSLSLLMPDLRICARICIFQLLLLRVLHIKPPLRPSSPSLAAPSACSTVIHPCCFSRK